MRKPRRSERYPSLVRVDTINGAPAEEVAEGTPLRRAAVRRFPSERLELGSDDPTLKAIEWLTPIGRGSRVAITGGALAGKTETLRRLAAALAGVEGLELSLVLAGVRPEEVAELEGGGRRRPPPSLTLAAAADAQGQALERAIETAQRIAARGGHAVVLVDTLDGLAPGVARRKALAAARAIVDGGSLTVIATAASRWAARRRSSASTPRRTAARNFPALDLRGERDAAPRAARRRRGRRRDRRRPRRPAGREVARSSKTRRGMTVTAAGPIPTERARELVRGGFDTHVHIDPDLIARRVDDVTLAGIFADRGLAGFLLKSHYVSTAERAQVVTGVASGGVQVLGAIALNAPSAG